MFLINFQNTRRCAMGPGFMYVIFETFKLYLVPSHIFKILSQNKKYSIYNTGIMNLRPSKYEKKVHMS